MGYICKPSLFPSCLNDFDVEMVLLSPLLPSSRMASKNHVLAGLSAPESLAKSSLTIFLLQSWVSKEMPWNLFREICH